LSKAKIEDFPLHKGKNLKTIILFSGEAHQTISQLT